jgi:hypothetical protein
MRRRALLVPRGTPEQRLRATSSDATVAVVRLRRAPRGAAVAQRGERVVGDEPGPDQVPDGVQHIVAGTSPSASPSRRAARRGTTRRAAQVLEDATVPVVERVDGGTASPRSTGMSSRPTRSRRKSMMRPSSWRSGEWPTQTSQPMAPSSSSCSARKPRTRAGSIMRTRSR